MEQRLREANERLSAVFEGVADGITLQNRDGRVRFANLPAARLCGFPDVASMMAAPLEEFPRRFALFDEHGQPLEFGETPGRKALATGQSVERLLRVHSRQNGHWWWSLVRATPLFGSDGAVEGVVNIWHDTTFQRRREETLRFLKDAGVLLSLTLEPAATLTQLAQLVVPQLADWCAIQTVEDGELELATVAHADAKKVELARALQERYPPKRDGANLAYQVLDSGQSVLLPEIPEQLLRAGAIDEEHERIIFELGLKSAMIVPLSARGRVVGVITFISAETNRRYDELDQLLADDLGRQAGLAVDNARLFARRARRCACATTSSPSPGTS